MHTEPPGGAEPAAVLPAKRALEEPGSEAAKRHSTAGGEAGQQPTPVTPPAVDPSAAESSGVAPEAAAAAPLQPPAIPPPKPKLQVGGDVRNLCTCPRVPSDPLNLKQMVAAGRLRRVSRRTASTLPTACSRWKSAYCASWRPCRRASGVHPDSRRPIVKP